MNTLNESTTTTHNRSGWHDSGRRLRLESSLKLAVRWPSLLLLALTCLISSARGAILVHEFYLPMPESQIRETMVALEPGTSSTLDSTFSVVVTGTGTIIYYDQWEDGYETALANPTQPSTLVWGDGNNANGIAPGFVNDPVGLASGTVLTLRNLVPLPRNASNILFDGRDRLAATKALVVSRMAWPTSPGSVLADAAEVPATIDYGTSYISPVGQDVPSSLFQYVALMVMAEADNTTVTIDADGPGAGVPYDVVLNRGESHLVNGGIMKGASVNATKPVQVDLVRGQIGARYETDWFALYPVADWSSSYLTPVGQTRSGYPTLVFLYNPNPTNITINIATRVGSSSVVVPGNSGVTQYQMPQNSGASFTSSGGASFFALSVVAAGSSSRVYDWGFTLLPTSGLTTEAVVGMGFGSQDGSQNGSPVWVTAPKATRVYVDYNGDRNGPLTDPLGNKYDVAYDIVALQSKTIYDPDKDQTAMRLYTLDGTVITAAWGEDPAVAGSGNPYLDAGTTVLPFPVPVLQKTALLVNDVAPPGLSIGDTLEYTVTLDNKGLLPLGNTLIIDALPTNVLSYVTNSTTWNGNPIADNVSGSAFPLDEPGYTIPIILRNGTSTFKFQTVTLSAGAITNVVTAVGYSLSAAAVITPPPFGGSAQCNLNFVNSGGTTVVAYPVGAGIYVRLTDNDANTASNSVQSVSVVVRNLTRSDLETITLTETGNNTGIFQNSTPLASSGTTGIPNQDGTLFVAASDALSAQYADPVYADSCSANAVIQAPAQTKVLYLSGTNSPDQNLDRVDPVATGDNTTAQSAVLSVGGNATIGVAATTFSNTTAAASSLTYNHTSGNGPNRLLVVNVGLGKSGGLSGATITNVTYGGQPLTQLVAEQNNGTVRSRTEIWYLLNPPSGPAGVVVSASTTVNIVAGAVTFTNANQATPFGSTSVGHSTSTTTSASLNVSSATGELVFAGIDVDGNGSAFTLAPGAGQSQLWQTNSAGETVGAASSKAGAATVTNSWTWTGSQEWAGAGVSIKPSAGGGGSNTVTFTQLPAFCSNFMLPSNNVVFVTNYVTVTSGSLPASPSVSATLKYGANTLLQLSNPVFTAASNTVVWSGLLTSNVTIPSGQALQLTVSNNQAGAAFRIDYDSITKPSKISLPATTIINVDSVGIYDAPYPGGNLVSTPVSGSLVYVRATVSDPFGAYDITSLSGVIDGPGVADDLVFSRTNAVAGDSCSKTYEVAWQTGATAGSYDVAVTAHEGTEGITHTAATGVTVVVLDLGTPSTTTFTSGDNGPATNSFAANANVCVRVNDQDQNTNAATIQTLSVIVSSSTGDSETLTLTETSTNSGLFSGCITASAAGGSGTNSGTLNAPAGSVLTASYTDVNDPTDQSSANGSILTPPATPGVNMSKTLVSPTDGQAGVGEAVVYNLRVINTGSTTLTNVSVTDTFPAANLTFVSASIAPNTSGAGTRTWTNVGPLTPGQSVNITVNFTAAAVAAPAINFASVNAGGSTVSSNSVPVTITTSALTITKTLLNPTNGPVPIGSNVTFRIVVLNSGTTVIPTLPLEDNFSGVQFEFVSATVTPDGTGAGSLLWNDITGAGSLAPSNSLTIDVTLQVTGSGNPSQNRAFADFAEDSYGNPVPSASGTASIVTGAARVTGHVYNDADQSGTLTGGDTGLAGVTVSIYSDPNADGDPTDGSLIRLATTGAAGDYELLNLVTGAYVVVETDLPGYASSAPANNRIPVVFTNLTTNANTDFFDYIPAVTNYATISGRVWSDTNANATLDVGEPGLASVAVSLVQDVNTNGLADIGEPTTDSATTDSTGSYTFYNVIPGSYVIVETDLFGYVSTADSQPPNDNQVGLTVGNGAVATNTFFLDWFTGNNPGNDAPQLAIAIPDQAGVYGTPFSYTFPTNTFTDVDPGTVFTYAVSNLPPGITFNGPTRTFSGTPTAAGTFSVTVTAFDDGAPALSAADTFDIAVATVPLTVAANNQTRAYGQTNPPLTNPPLTYTLSGFVLSDTTNVVSGTPALNTAATTNSPVGIYPITVSLGSLVASNYSFVFTNGSLSVTSATPVIVWTPVGPIVYGTSLGTNQNSATLSVPGTPVYSPTNGTVLPVGTNTLSVVYTPTNTNYTTVSNSVSLVVLPASLTVAANSQTRAYGQTNAPLTYNLSGFVNGENTNAISGAPALNTTATTNSPVGVYPITVSIGSLVASNYSFVFTNGSLSVTSSTPVITWTPVGPIIYGTPLGTNQNNATLSVPGSPVYSPTNGTVLPVGTNTLSVVYTPTDTNFAPVNLSVPLVVVRTPLTVAANSQTRAYGQTNAPLTYNLSGFVNGENTNAISGTPTLNTTATTNSPVDVYPITVAVGSLVASNYSFVFTNGSLSVTSSTPVITWTPVGPIIYGTPLGTNQNNATLSVPGSPVYSPTNGTVLPVGTNTLSVVYTPTDTNFAPVNLSVPLVVVRAPLTVAANSQTRAYGQTNSPLTYNLSGFVNGESTNAISGTPSLNTTATTNSPVGVYPITVSIGSLVASNYSFVFTNGSLSVTSSTPVITWTPVGPITYGTPLGTNQNNATLSVPGTPVYNSTNGTVLPVGTNTLSVVYTPTDTNFAPVNASVTLVVLPAPLTVAANNQTRAYGQTNAPLTYNLSGFVNGENTNAISGTPSLNTTATTNSPVGVYPITVSIGSLVASNYSFVFTNGSLSVTSAAPIITWFPLGPITYGTPLNTNQNNATPSVPGSRDYSPTNGTVLPAGTNILTIVFTPTDTNYAALTNSVTLVVLPAPLTLTANNQTKILGSVLTLGAGQTAFTTSGLQNGDTLGSVTLASAGAGAGAAIGAYPIVASAATGGTFNANNYNLTYNSGTLNVVAGAMELAVIIVGTNVLNGQDGLYEATVIVTNTGALVNGVRLKVQKLRSLANTNHPVTLWNATGTTSGVPYVQYNLPVGTGESVRFLLEFSNPYRDPFTNTYAVEAVTNVPPPSLPPANPVFNTNSFKLTLYQDQNTNRTGRLFLGIKTVVGKNYAVIYTDNPANALTNWNVATPPFTATASTTSWYDDGPPKTTSAPQTTNRFYQVIQY